MAERKLAARNDRVKLVEQQLVDASQAVSKRELEHKLQHARWVLSFSFVFIVKLVCACHYVYVRIRHALHTAGKAEKSQNVKHHEPCS